jgi:acyl carrier protein
MTDRESLRQTLVELLEADTGDQYADLTEDKKLREELGLDSVDVVSIVSQIERRYHIRLSHKELETLVTVSDVLTLLQTKLDAPPQTAAA